MARPRSPAPLDALEAAKADPAPSQDPEPLQPASAPAATDSRGEPDLPPATPELVVYVKPKLFRVERKITVSWGPQMLTLNPGDEISEASYGPGCIARMRECGVSLVEVTD